jgi:hypothetical protein
MKFLLFCLILVLFSLEYVVSTNEDTLTKMAEPAVFEGENISDSLLETKEVTKKVSEISPSLEDSSAVYTPFSMFPESFFDILLPIKAPVFMVMIYSVLYYSLVMMKNQSLDLYSTLGFGFNSFFAAFVTYDIIHRISATYLQSGILLVTGILVIHASLLSMLAASYVTEISVSRDVLLGLNAVLIGYYNILVYTRERIDCNTLFYAYTVIPVVGNLGLLSLKAKSSNTPIVTDYLVKKIESISQYTVARGAGNSLVALLWLIYLTFLTPLRFIFNRRMSYLQTIWVGFVSLYGLPLLMKNEALPESYNKLADIYFGSLPMKVIEPTMSKLREITSPFRKYMYTIVGSFLPVCTALGYFSPVLSPIYNTIVPQAIREWIATEFYYIIVLVRHLTQNGIYSMAIVSVCYVLSFVFLYYTVFNVSLLESCKSVFWLIYARYNDWKSFTTSSFVRTTPGIVPAAIPPPSSYNI